MQRESPFYVEDAIELIRQKMSEASPNWIRKIMRKMKLTRITEVSIRRMVACLSIHSFGLPITTELLATVLDMRNRRGQLSMFLHGLGDKGCLTLKRGTGGQHYEWIVSSVFWKYFNEGWEKEKIGV